MPQPSLNYLNFSDQLHYIKKEADISELSEFFTYGHRLQQDGPFFRDLIFFIIDYRKRSYLLMTGPVQEVCSYHPHDFLKGGLDFAVDICHEDDFRIFNKTIFPSNLQFIREHPQEEHSSYVFEYSFRIRRRPGDYLRVLQKGILLTDPVTCLPEYGVGVTMNISAYKRDTSMLRIISQFDPHAHQGHGVRNISTDYYYPDPADARLSKREKEVLLWIAEGWSSKLIAGKLRLSESTVVNHRKNILKKTNTRNVAELISYSIRNGII
jgi:DNA-binding CsgD family transcriptional regulator